MKKIIAWFVFAVVCAVGFFEPDPPQGQQQAIFPLIAAAAITAVGGVASALISKKSAKEQQSRQLRADKAIIEAQTKSQIALMNNTPSSAMTGTTLQVADQSKPLDDKKIILYVGGGLLLAKLLKIF